MRRKKKEARLLVVGPLPQNHGLGGVTIHVQRLCEYLDGQHVKYDFIDYKSDRLLKILREIASHDVTHLHISNPALLYAMVVYGRLAGRTVILTLHGNYGRFGKLKNGMTKRSIRLATIPIVINSKSFEACKRINRNTQQIPAFIPPQKEEQLPVEIVSLIERLHGEGKKVFSTNASYTGRDKHGNDIYGIDFLVNYFSKSKDSALIVSDPTGNYHRQYTSLESETVFFIDYPHPYFEVLKLVDYFVRNTSTDGDALSVKEALYLGVPALCTDVVDRPEGVRLFKYCDKDTFTKAIGEATEQTTEIENGAELILKIYKKQIDDL
mgnify:FL=1